MHQVSIPNGDKHDFKQENQRRRPAYAEFQSPMGISMISNLKRAKLIILADAVSIPNGDKHDFKRDWNSRQRRKRNVSIPNGDKHDFKLSNVARCRSFTPIVSIPNGDKHDFKPRRVRFVGEYLDVSIPNGDKHDFKLCDRSAVVSGPWFQSPMGISMISNWSLNQQS